MWRRDTEERVVSRGDGTGSGTHIILWAYFGYLDVVEGGLFVRGVGRCSENPQTACRVAHTRSWFY